MMAVLLPSRYAARPKLVQEIDMSMVPRHSILACPHMSIVDPTIGETIAAAMAYDPKIIPVQSDSMPRSSRIVGKNGLASP